MYEKSYMHRDVVTHVAVSAADFFITGSIDGHLKFWKKKALGIEFAKHFRSHLGAIEGLAVSVDGLLCCTISSDNSVKIYDVVNYDMMVMMRLPFVPGTIEWVYKPGDVKVKLAVSDRDSSKVHIYDARSDSRDPIIEKQIHMGPIKVMKYNHIFDVVISADDMGLIEYWCPTTLQFPENRVNFKFKSDTNLFEIAKCKTAVSAIEVSSDGKQFAITSPDRRIRVFWFKTGKLRRVYDESLEVAQELQRSDAPLYRLEAIDFGRRMAVEKEIEKTENVPQPNAIFDESCNFLIYATLLGIKIVNLHTNKPKSKWIQEWNRVFLLVCATGLAIDPLFFYALSISDTCMCLFVDGWFAITVTVLRCMTDAVHLCNMWLQLKMVGSMDRTHAVHEEECKESHTRARCSAVHYLRSKKGFFFDVFVILPVPQIVLWVVAPSLIAKGSTTTVMTIFLIMFLFQYFPKIYHSVCLLRRMQNLSGYIFGTVWWGIALNLIAYFVASHAAGACWYLLGIQRASKCLRLQCRETMGCGLRMLGCEEPIYYGTAVMKDRGRLAWGGNKQARLLCLSSSEKFDYGAFKWTVPLVTNTSRLEKMLFPIFWGLMTLSTFGNLESTTEWLEVVFNIIVLTSGLLLVTMLIGNIKVFLHATTSKKQTMHLRMRNVEWWMKKRHLPQGFRQRVRQYERQRWAAMRGVDESEMICNLPEGLRRDIKYHLCLDLVRQVPLFQHMDELVLENICDRAKSLIIPKGETITKEGDPVQRMLFVVRGHLQSSQVLRDSVKSYCMLGPGNFSGDELLSWCLRRPFVERLPPSSYTLVTLETTEVFGLEAADLKYVTQHFRYTFVNERVKRSARYYSPGWRTWAAVAIQLAWRRYKHRLTLTSLSFIRPRRPLSRCSSLGEDRLRLYTALLTSPKPNQDDFSF